MNEPQIALKFLRKTLEELDSQARELDAKREQIRGTIRHLEEARKTATKRAEVSLSSVPNLESEETEKPFPYHKIKNLSQPRAMVVIARHFDGILRTRNLAQILVAAGVMRKTKNTSAMASRLLRTSDRFERISEGLYRLKGSESKSTDIESQRSSSASPMVTVQ